MSAEITVYEVIAYLVRAFTGFTTTVERNQRNIMLRVKDFPIYGKNRPEDVIFYLPVGNIKVGSVIKIRMPINSTEVHIKCGEKSYRHPHIFDDGHPCWNGSVISDLTSLFEMIVMTLLWTNVTDDSREFGHYTSCECIRVMGNDYQRRIVDHKAKLKAAAKKIDETPGQFFTKRFPALVENALAVA